MIPSNPSQTDLLPSVPRIQQDACSNLDGHFHGGRYLTKAQGRCLTKAQAAIDQDFPNV